MTTGFKPRQKPKSKRPAEQPMLTAEEQRERDRHYVPTPCLRTDRWLNKPRHVWVQHAWIDETGEEQVSEYRTFGPVLAIANLCRTKAQKWDKGQQLLHIYLIDGGCPERYLRCPPEVAIWVAFWNPNNVPPMDIATANGKTECVLHYEPGYVLNALRTIERVMMAIAFWEGYHYG